MSKTNYFCSTLSLFSSYLFASMREEVSIENPLMTALKSFGSSSGKVVCSQLRINTSVPDYSGICRTPSKSIFMNYLAKSYFSSTSSSSDILTTCFRKVAFPSIVYITTVFPSSFRYMWVTTRDVIMCAFLNMLKLNTLGIDHSRIRHHDNLWNARIRQ